MLDSGPSRFCHGARVACVYPESLEFSGRYVLMALRHIPWTSTSRPQDIRRRRIEIHRRHCLGRSKLCSSGVDPSIGLQRHVGESALCLVKSHDVGFRDTYHPGHLVLCWVLIESQMVAQWRS